MSMLAMQEVLQKIHKLPSLPTVVMELLASIDQEDTDVGALAVKISQDQALTAKALRLANSSFYGMAHEVTTMQQSIAILGFRTIRSVATTAALISLLPGRGSPAFDLSAFWRHCIATAVCARELAPSLGINSEHAYTAGLLHDIGLLVLVTQFPSGFDAVLAHQAQQGGTLIEAERAVLGLDHAVVGHALTQHWKFPKALQQAVAVHNALPQADEDGLVTVVRAASAMALALADTMDEGAEVPPGVLESGKPLGLDATAMVQVVVRVRKDFAGACLVLGT